MINLKIVGYKLFDYELDYLKKEIQCFGGQIKSRLNRGAVVQVEGLTKENALKLTYVEGIIEKSKLTPTLQYIRESCNGSKKGQSTRYGPHSLHEYKGRFNPHHPRSIMLREFENKKSVILDPFMGSGTTLVEARGLNQKSVGIELNIFAWLIANAKKYYEEIKHIPEVKVKTKQKYFDPITKEYLSKWFPVFQLSDLENILTAISQFDIKEKTILQIILSDLLREHSFQDPRDLRIRRRKNIPQDLRLLNSFQVSLNKHRQRHAKWIKTIGQHTIQSFPLQGNSTMLSNLLKKKVDGTVSSPPYASALPYVDTYRLSMVALGLIQPNEILKSERTLIGARDISRTDQELFLEKLRTLPNEVGKIISHIKKTVDSDSKAGFRKRAVPFSLTKYSFLMKKVLEDLYKVEVSGAKNFWVVGPNKIKLGSEWYTIDTPSILGSLAETVGFKNVNIKPVQTYLRYNIHSKNSIESESILEFTKYGR